MGIFEALAKNFGHVYPLKWLFLTNMVKMGKIGKISENHDFGPKITIFATLKDLGNLEMIAVAMSICAVVYLEKI